MSSEIKSQSVLDSDDDVLERKLS